MKSAWLLVAAFALQSTVAVSQTTVKIDNGTLEGTSSVGIRSFKGIPFAAPPVGQLRWKQPQPVKNWEGVRKADRFGPRAMQRALFSDMNFRSDGMSEDCLYLNVWTPSSTGKDKLPVLVYFYGGGLVGGDGSEFRYDGEALARKGIVTLTVNYRLTVFGFLAHPELTAESPHHASGNYGLMDQAAALQWVQKNIAAFGGDPKRVTIAGESAGSFSVSAQMASPLSKDLIAGAIGESGSLLGPRNPVPLAAAEEAGKKFQAAAGLSSLAELRSMKAEEVLQLTAKPNISFPVCVDGYFFPATPNEIYGRAQQAKVPLLAGWNSEEAGFRSVMGNDSLTKKGFEQAVQRLYGNNAPAVLKAYEVPFDADVEQVATDLAGDRFIGLSTWKWSDMHASTSGKPVFRYLYAHPRPAVVAAPGTQAKPANKGAVHSAEIEYALGNLPTNKVFNWTADDYKVSEQLQGYFVNFIKTGNPNGKGLADWPAIKPGTKAMVMRIDVKSEAKPEVTRERYLQMDKIK